MSLDRVLDRPQHAHPYTPTFLPCATRPNENIEGLSFNSLHFGSGLPYYSLPSCRPPRQIRNHGSFEDRRFYWLDTRRQNSGFTGVDQNDRFAPEQKLKVSRPTSDRLEALRSCHKMSPR